MLERVGNNDILVRNYTSNFDVKQYITEHLIPNAFPDVPMNKLNLGFTGIVSEMLSQGIEDSYYTASLFLNEAFTTRSVLPNSIYSEASLFELGYQFASPSRCSFALQCWLEDIIKHSVQIRNTNLFRFVLDKNTKLILGEATYRLDHDIIIDHQYIDGRRAFNVYYDMTDLNSIAIPRNRHINHQVTPIGWLVLILPNLQEFERKVEENTLADNLITTNSDLYLRFPKQIAGFDLTYITPRGERLPMKAKIQHTRPEQDPFCWYSFYNETTIRLMFSNSRGFFQPDFNSKIESTIYICQGSSANFDEYDNKVAVQVQRTGERFEYNAATRVVALCYGGSRFGADRGDIELLRDDVIMAHNTVNVLSTDNDLSVWFNNFARRHNTKAYFFKRRDDPTGRLFSQFVAIVDNTYVYPTNTLMIDIEEDQFDFVNNDSREFIIKPGRLWEYDGDSRDRLVPIMNADDEPARITDELLPYINDSRPFMFTNPFYIKIHRRPTMTANYNFLIDHTSWPEEVPVETEIFYQFQLATFSIYRSLTRESNNRYRIQVICVPVVTQDTINYVEGIGDEYPKGDNALRLIMVTRTRQHGETGYIEMEPIEYRNGGAILFETYLAVDDNLNTDMTLRVDDLRTPGIISLMVPPTEANPDPPPSQRQRIFIDSAETSFHFLVMFKDPANLSTAPVFGNVTGAWDGYTIVNRFSNNHRDLTLYKPMNMMRSVVNFAGTPGDYKIRAELIPFMKYDVPLDPAKMSYFIRAFNDQYDAVEPVLRRLDNNCFLDFKLFNTYGRSNNYYVGPPDDSDVLWDSDELLDNVYVKSRWRMAVHDRTAYVQTQAAVVDEIKTFFKSLDTGELRDIHISDLIHAIKDNQPNVKYIRFLGFNDYDANKQSIFVKYDDISDLRMNQLRPYVPEMIRTSDDRIEIIEEI